MPTHCHDRTQKKLLTSGQIYIGNNRKRCTQHLVRGLQPPPPGGTISLVGTQLRDLADIHHTKKPLCLLLRGMMSHALPSVGAAARSMHSQTLQTWPAHKYQQMLPHKPEVTPHQTRPLHRASWQLSPPAHHQKNPPIPW
jgi:hypothetical protein